MMPFVAQMLLAVSLFAAQEPVTPAQMPLPPLASSSPTIRILVTNNDEHLSRRVLSSAQDATARLYDAAGIHIEWVDNVSRDLPMVVAFPPAGGAERLRVGINAMGYTFRTESPGPGGRALVFFDRVERQAMSSRTDIVRLLGAVIAHEICHMLLADAHMPTGLMRGVWTDHEFSMITMGFLRFSAVERVRMQSQLTGVRLLTARVPD